MFEQAFPQQFKDTSTGITLHIASYSTIKKRRCWHCFVSENGAYLGYVIFHQRNSDTTPSSLLVHKNILKETIPTQEVGPIMDYCRKTVSLSCRVGRSYSFLKQNRVSFTPSLRYPTQIWHPLFRSQSSTTGFPRALEVTTTSNVVSFPSPWCEESASFCMKYGGISNDLFLAIKDKMFLSDPTRKNSMIERGVQK